jgi:8-oxo-dGTP pyrophosphatase MutT (NUDIX family)
MKKSCGIIVLLGEKILLCHPTSSRWEGTYGVPKGKVHEGEEHIDCAVREFREETGITIDKDKLNANMIISYENYQTKEIYKELYLFVHKIDSLSDIGLETETVPQSQLQLEEIDWCGFLTKDEALTKIFAKQISVLKFL